ncbi:hypothetical protein [Sphingobacterium bovistauri]|uniref:Outer membrane protein beta-barrel domain-containing protein n=1 Tax=Sphingobacterium bovistauri TaxID=2781959 RepID=A0ABS7Z2E9_9SPHI|nr:hypothetical protein [Sphingobacterium bovistauri]MCA5004335.1 hypothetical protein [Sphingobacterium bovistauri]
MKRILFCVLFLISFMGSNAQEVNSEISNFRKNDLLLDPITLIAGPIINVSYERLLSADHGIGISFIGGNGIDVTQISPFARMYFGSKYASGFFIEGFIPFTKSNDYNYETSQDIEVSTVGAGFGLGGKWFLKKNFLFELGGGVARRFGANGAEENVTGKWMIGVGYRF